MKLCIVTPSFSGGGAEKVAINLANYYGCNGYIVLLIVFNAFGPYRDQIHPSVKLIDLNSRNFITFWRLLIVLKQQRPHAILSVMRDSNIITCLAGFLCPNIKIIIREANTMHGILQMPTLKRYAWLALMRITYFRADKIIANSKDTKRDLISRSIIKNNIFVVSNPVLPQNFDNMAAEAVSHPWFNDKGVYVILTVGRLSKQKNQTMLIESFAKVQKKISNTRLIILGEGEEKENLLDCAKKLGVESFVQFIDFQENPYPYYKKADLFVLTSEWEGFGNVLVEAMACGLPVISTDCPGGPRSILKNGKFGKLIPVGDVFRLTYEIISTIKTQITENKIRAAKIRAMEFSVDRIAKLYMKIICNGIELYQINDQL